MSLQWQLKAPWLPSDCCRFLPIENGREIQSGRIFLGVPMSRCFPIEHGREIHVNSYAPGHGEWKYNEPLFAVAIAHCSLATSLVSRSTLIYHCLWRSEKKRTVGRRRKRSVLICNLCGFTKSTHLPLSLEVCMSNMVAAPNNQAPMVFLSREKVSLFFLSARPLVRFPSC